MQDRGVSAERSRVCPSRETRRPSNAGIRDLARILPIYAPEIVSFEIEPPLRHFGPEAKEKNWMRAFSVYQPPLGYEVRDLAINVGDDVAFAYSLGRERPETDQALQGVQ